jgi:hypothetical protein
MCKTAKILLLFIGLSLLSLFLATFALAAPSAPANVVNHKTKECAMIARGDECQTCVPTGDWEILIGNCPEGYTKLDKFVQNSCAYNGNENSMCNYAAVNQNTKYFLDGIVIVVLLSAVIFIILHKKDNMLKKSFSLESDKPTRLEITWAGSLFWVKDNITIKCDNVILGSYQSRTELENGQEFQLQNGPLLKVRLASNNFEILYNGKPVREINNVRDFLIGFVGWLLLSNLIFWIFIFVAILVGKVIDRFFYSYGIPYMFFGLACIWLTTIISIVLFAKKKVWRSTGIVAAVLINIAAGILLTKFFPATQGVRGLSGTLMEILTPIPSDFLTAILFFVTGKY